MLVIAKTKDKDLGILPEMANRHILVTGSTGAGKSRTIQVLAENFCKAGVPVFIVDVKGDLAGLAKTGVNDERIATRVKALGLHSYTFQDYPTRLWDLFGEKGHPIRTTVEKIGPVLLSRLLGLDNSEAQQGTLMQIFKIASDHNWKLITLADLKTVLDYALENAKTLTGVGRLSTSCIGTIQRSILNLEMQQGDLLFGESSLDIADLMKVVSGYGMINILAADKLMQNSTMYSAVLLNLLTQIYSSSELPEVGDLPMPKLALIFDEASLIFKDCSKPLLATIEKVVRLVRSKGCSLTFITQNPSSADIPDSILNQLQNRLQHKLNSYSEKAQKAVAVAAQTMRQNPMLDSKKIISELATGEILISCLDEKGIPNVVERALVYPPHSRIGTITDTERQAIINKSPLLNKYGKTDVGKESTAVLIKREQPVQQYSNRKQKEDIPIGIKLLDILLKSGAGKGFVGKLLKMM
jgi:DNA helicase HerA-like ATPase